MDVVFQLRPCRTIAYRQWRRQVSEFGGAFEGQTHILGGQDRIFKKVLLYRHRGTNILGISPPPPRGANAPGISPPPPPPPLGYSLPIYAMWFIQIIS